MSASALSLSRVRSRSSGARRSGSLGAVGEGRSRYYTDAVANLRLGANVRANVLPPFTMYARRLPCCAGQRRQCLHLFKRRLVQILWVVFRRVEIRYQLRLHTLTRHGTEWLNMIRASFFPTFSTCNSLSSPSSSSADLVTHADVARSRRASTSLRFF